MWQYQRTESSAKGSRKETKYKRLCTETVEQHGKHCTLKLEAERCGSPLVQEKKYQ
jgi:hypothetical protein